MKKSLRFLLLWVALVWIALSCNLGVRLSERADGSPTNSPAPLSPTAPSFSPTGTPGLLPGTVPPLSATEALPITETPELLPETPPPVSETESLPTAEPPTSTPTPCAEETCTYAGSFLLSRPVAPPGRNIIDVSDRFGSYEQHTRGSNHGVSFLNSSGTPVLAAAAGVVVVAGDDSLTNYGLRPNMYGSLVILQHELPELSQPVFTLYAHLSQVFVKTDDPVQAGQEIGLVGMSGSVRGSTLHFEVRLGENTYPAARNPELWLTPLLDETGQPYGALAGRVLDANGQDLAIHNILIEQLGDPGGPAIDQIYLKTYADRRLIGLSPWEEGFATGGLKAGSYQISFWQNGLQQRVVQILPDQLTFVLFQIK